MKIFKRMLVGILLLSLFPIHNAHAENANNHIPYDKMYQIVVDRFYNFDSDDEHAINTEDPNALQGGDLRGVEHQLDHIEDLGFNAIWLSPVFESNDYLGYDVIDYSMIKESLGGQEALHELIESAHERNMKVIIDVPTTYTSEFQHSVTPMVNNIQASYYENFDASLIDLTHHHDQNTYLNYIEQFVSEYDVDGISMFIGQDGVDRNQVLPNHIDTYAVTTSDEITTENFDYTITESMRTDIAHSFSFFDHEILEYPEEENILLADHWFSERFVHHAVENRAFPVTRIKQLATYLTAYPGPSSMMYGTEVAFNGSDIPETHQNMTFWSERELMDYFSNMTSVFNQYHQLYEAELTTLHNENGLYVTRYNTSDVDFILYLNDTSETENFTLPLTGTDEGKMVSGLLTGELARSSNDNGEQTVPLITDREVTELYAIIEERGLNIGYFIAALIILVSFGTFIFLVARRSNHKYEN